MKKNPKKTPNEEIASGNRAATIGEKSSEPCAAASEWIEAMHPQINAPTDTPSNRVSPLTFNQ